VAGLVVLVFAGVFFTGLVAASPTGSVAVTGPFRVYAEFTPTDPFFVDQWGLRKIGAPSAWDATLGSRSVVVAVVDTGAWWTHPDLRPNMWTNPIDGTHGWDFVSQDSNPMDVDPAGIYHGTGVSGVIAAVIDNGQFIAGTAQVSLMAVRALGPNGQGSSFNVSQAIRWAADHNAKIINLSLGTNETFGGPTDIQLAIDYAWSRGALIVAAAGNSATSTLDYPARLANVVSVAAIDETGRRASFSNYGPGLSLSAPGDRILTLNGNNDVHYLRGTSFSAPFVSASAALLLSVDDTLTNKDLWNILNSTAVQPTGSGYNTDYGWGVVSVSNAIDAIRTTPFISVNAPPSSVSRGSTFDISWSIRGPAGLTVADTHAVWGTASGRLGNTTPAQSGMTRQTFSASRLTMPSGANALYFKVVATVNGTQYSSREYSVAASSLPDFLFVLYQLLASNLLILALFILALAAVVAFLPQRRAARARRAAYRSQSMYPTYYPQAARPSQPPPSAPTASQAAWTTNPSYPAQPPPSAPAAATPLPPLSHTRKRCPNCGTMVNADNLFCFFCGHPFT
jgi:hypothetical protein